MQQRFNAVIEKGMTSMIDIQELQDRLLNAERKLRELSHKETNESQGFRLAGKAEGVALARSYVEEMARW